MSSIAIWDDEEKVELRFFGDPVLMLGCLRVRLTFQNPTSHKHVNRPEQGWWGYDDGTNERMLRTGNGTGSSAPNPKPSTIWAVL